MNPFQRARDEAWKLREKLAPGKALLPIKAKELISAVEGVLQVSIFQVDANHPDLGGGSAALLRKNDLIYVSKAFEELGEKYCGLVAHELGHLFLDPNQPEKTIAHLKALTSSEGSPATLKVESYGARERLELQANVFARELLLPRRVARQLVLAGTGAQKVALDLGIPLEFARQQMLDAALLPDVEFKSEKLHPPSDDQKAAAQAQERFVNVVAGPGTGKTSTLVHRVKYLIETRGVDPGQILVLTFSNKAAFELIERLRIAGIPNSSEVWAGTFHSFGLEFLRKYHQRFHLNPDINVSDKVSDISALIKALANIELEYFNRLDDPYRWLGKVYEAISRLKEHLISPKAYASMVDKHKSVDESLQRKRRDVAKLFALNEQLLVDRKTVDFVDLISKPALAMQADRAPYAELADKFKYILVDEYQDVTEAMVELLRQLAHNGKSLWVVGDIRQAIHHWRGASMRSLSKFSTEYLSAAGNKSIQQYALLLNRRSSKEVLDLVDEMGRRHKLEQSFPLVKLKSTKGPSGKKPVLITCKDYDYVNGAVAAEVKALHSVLNSYRKQVVLSRGGLEVSRLAEHLSQADVPTFYIGELGQRSEVKIILCLMQLLVERTPRALYGLAGLPALKMPAADIRLLLDLSESDPSVQRGGWIRKLPQGISKTGAAVAAELKRLIGQYKHFSRPWDFVCDLLLEFGVALPPHTDQSVPAWLQRIALWQFAYAVRNGDGDTRNATLTRYLLRQRLRQRLGETYHDRELPAEASELDAVRILTVHGSKGLEYDAVHLAHVTANSYGSKAPDYFYQDGIEDVVPPLFLGSDDAAHADEEAVERNNLLYVALSRAKQHLHLYQHSGLSGRTQLETLRACNSLYVQKQFSDKVGEVKPKKYSKAFEPPETVPFDHFDRYVTCPLQYWYANVLELRREQESDSSLRARLAVVEALKAYASGKAGTPQKHMENAWANQKLPSSTLDPFLYKDAIAAFERGIKLSNSALLNGGKFSEPQSEVAGLTIELGWGHARKIGTQTEFSMVRFSDVRKSEVLTRLKPMVNGMKVKGNRDIHLRYVMSDGSDKVKPAYQDYIQSTTSHKAATKFMAGDIEPTNGKHCTYCAYMTICPNAGIPN